MNRHTLNYDGFSFFVAEGWAEISATLEDVYAPLTVADPVSGVGALQFSPAIFKQGQLPRVGQNDLSELLDDFIETQSLDEPFDRSTHPGEVAVEGASFQAGGDFIRAWYASDGKNMMFVTYVCDWNHRDQEVAERELAVLSICFEARALSETSPTESSP